MADPARRLATHEDLIQVPDHLVSELLNGELVTSPRPAPPHAQAASSLAGELYAPFHRGRGGPGGWIILNEPELHLRADVLVPDIAGWRRERMPALPQTSAFDLAPDWLCEVLSPSTAASDRAVKVPIYAREQVAHVWLVDPLLQTLEVLRLDGAGYRFVEAFSGDTVGMGGAVRLTRDSARLFVVCLTPANLAAPSGRIDAPAVWVRAVGITHCIECALLHAFDGLVPT